MDLSMLMELQPALSRRAPGQGRSDAFRLPGLLLLYVVAKNSREAVLRGGCLVQSLQHVLLDTVTVASGTESREKAQEVASLQKFLLGRRAAAVTRSDVAKRPQFFEKKCFPA